MTHGFGRVQRELLQARGLRRRLVAQPPGRHARPRRRHGELTSTHRKQSRRRSERRPPAAPDAITAVRPSPTTWKRFLWPTKPHAFPTFRLPPSPPPTHAQHPAARSHESDVAARVIKAGGHLDYTSIPISGDRNAAAAGAGAGAAGPPLRPVPPVEPLRAVLGPRRRHLRQLQGACGDDRPSPVPSAPPLARARQVFGDMSLGSPWCFLLAGLVGRSIFRCASSARGSSRMRRSGRPCGSSSTRSAPRRCTPSAPSSAASSSRSLPARCFLFPPLIGLLAYFF